MATQPIDPTTVPIDDPVPTPVDPPIPSPGDPGAPDAEPSQPVEPGMDIVQSGVFTAR